MRRRIWVLVVCAGMAAPLVGQATARQAKPGEVAQAERGPASVVTQEIPSPMLLEVQLGGPGRKGINELEIGQTWISTSTAKFICDRANVRQVDIRRLKSPAHRRLFEVSATITSGWYRQDIDLTLRVLAADGSEARRKHWDDYTIGLDSGPYSGGTRRPTLELYIKAEELEALYADGKAPRLELLVEIQGEQGDEDED